MEHTKKSRSSDRSFDDTNTYPPRSLPPPHSPLNLTRYDHQVIVVVVVWPLSRYHFCYCCFDYWKSSFHLPLWRHITVLWTLLLLWWKVVVLMLQRMMVELVVNHNCYRLNVSYVDESYFWVFGMPMWKWSLQRATISFVSYISSTFCRRPCVIQLMYSYLWRIISWLL